MSCPLASIVNPLAKPGANPNQVMLFYLTQDHQSVGLALYDVRAPQPEPEDPDDQVAITGIKPTPFRDNLSTALDLKIVNPGSFSALRANNMINVYGFVQAAPPAAGQKVEPAATKRIAQLSPVYKVLLPDETNVEGVKSNNLVIGVGMTTIVDAKGQGYMYCLTQLGGSGSACIAEFAVGWSSSKKTTEIINTPMLSNPPLASTNLAAVFEPNGGKKSIIYQTKDNLRIVESNGNNDSPIPNTDDARKGTGLAIVPITSDATNNTKLYIYYFNTAGKLQQVIREENGSWGSSNEKNQTVSAENSSLTASGVGKTVLLHFLDGAGKIKWVRDEI